MFQDLEQFRVLVTMFRTLCPVRLAIFESGCGDEVTAGIDDRTCTNFNEIRHLLTLTAALSKLKLESP